MLGSAHVLPVLSYELWDTVALAKVAHILNGCFFSLFWEFYHPTVGNKRTMVMFTRTFGFQLTAGGSTTVQCPPPELAQTLRGTTG